MVYQAKTLQDGRVNNYPDSDLHLAQTLTHPQFLLLAKVQNFVHSHTELHELCADFKLLI